tara:strand:+ start:204 stop:392 length:189 start_codon:yes stop_codon:yes gene_type:complete
MARDSYKNVSKVYTKWFFIVMICLWISIVIYNVFIAEYYIAIGHVIAIMLITIAGLGKMRFK